MKKIIVSLFTMAALLLPVASQAAEKTGIYVAPKFALNIQSTEIASGSVSSGTLDDTTVGGALAVGYDFSYKFDVPARVELEFGMFGALEESESASGYGATLNGEVEVGIKTLLVNGYWDIADYNGFTPYVGAGLGMAFIKTEAGLSGSYQGQSGSISLDDTTTVFAAQIGVGCAYAITDTFAVDFGYRCLAMGDGEIEVSGVKVLESQDNIAHQFMLGLRVTF